jgi:hypothetical protein
MRYLTTALFVAAFSAAAFVSAHEHARVPDTLASSVPGAAPAWVSAEAAFDRKGNLREELFAAGGPRSIARAKEKMRQSGAAGTTCQEFYSSPPFGLPVSGESVDALAASASNIVVGKVVATKGGFYLGIPGTLFALSVDEQLKGKDPARRTVRYFFLSDATIDTPYGPICARTFSKVPTPSLGDRVLLFSTGGFSDREQDVLPFDSRKQILIEHEGSVAQPPALLTPAGDGSFDRLVEAVRVSPRRTEVPVESPTESH